MNVAQAQSTPAGSTQPEIRRFAASDGYRLHYRHWRTGSGQPLGYIVGLHGIQSHSGWYEYSSRRLAEAGFEVSFLDRRGSGLNEDQRGHAPHCERLLNDVVQFLGDVRDRRNRRAPVSPVILLAVSWGGKLAAPVAGRRPELVDALALLYPGLCAQVRPKRHQLLQLRLAVALGLHRRRVTVPLDDPALFTDDPKWQQFIREDEKALHEVTVSLLNANRQLDGIVQSVPDRLRCPTLLMLAGRDRIIDNRATRQWFERIATADRKLIEYPEAAHTLEFEADREQVVGDLLDWLQAVRRRF